LKIVDYNKVLNLQAGTKSTALLSLMFNHAGKKVTLYFEVVRKRIGSNSFWLFKCPLTGKLCLHLYYVDGKYGHRDAFRGKALYVQQALSKKQRQMREIFDQEYSAGKLKIPPFGSARDRKTP